MTKQQKKQVVLYDGTCNLRAKGVDYVAIHLGEQPYVTRTYRKGDSMPYGGGIQIVPITEARERFVFRKGRIEGLKG